MITIDDEKAARVEAALARAEEMAYRVAGLVEALEDQEDDQELAALTGAIAVAIVLNIQCATAEERKNGRRENWRARRERMLKFVDDRVQVDLGVTMAVAARRNPGGGV